MGIQELQAALLAEQHDEAAVSATAAGLGVAISAEEAVGDVQDPFLGLPPRPRCPCLSILWLPLLQYSVAFYVSCWCMKTDLMSVTHGRNLDTDSCTPWRSTRVKLSVPQPPAAGPLAISTPHATMGYAALSVDVVQHMSAIQFAHEKGFSSGSSRLCLSLLWLPFLQQHLAYPTSILMAFTVTFDLIFTVTFSSTITYHNDCSPTVHEDKSPERVGNMCFHAA